MLDLRRRRVQGDAQTVAGVSSERSLDVSGDWTGTYSYPRAIPPVAFSASLSEQGGWISGVVEERSWERLGPPRRLGASIQGRRAGVSVTWLKLYDDHDASYDAVQYEGAVSPDGEEISGRWSIAGSWAGTFLMVRKSRATANRNRRAAARA